MTSRKILNKILFLAVLLFVLHILALKFYLYWTIWWYDMPVHFVGGWMVSLILISVFQKKLQSENKRRTFLKILIGVLLVGILWELFEYYTGMIRLVENNWLNPATDILMDILGGAVGINFFIKSTYKKI